MDTSKYRKGDLVKFHGDAPEECDTGTVVYANDTFMKVYWDEAADLHEEDPHDDRISLISRK